MSRKDRLRRIRLQVCYDGTEFAGSQIQPDVRTVASTLKAGLESILDADVDLIFASRTDAGVHADSNYCVFDAAPRFPVTNLPQVIASTLPVDLVVREAVEVATDFNPRYAALSREYVYRVYRGGHVPVDRMRYVARHTGHWDSDAVHGAMELIEGEHSFLNFAMGGEDKGEGICEVAKAWTEELGDEVELRFIANRFLRNMVRRLVGTIIDIAQGDVSAMQLEQALCGGMDILPRKAPAQGLTLVGIEF